MFSIQMENKRESVVYAVALGGLLLFIIGITWMFWSNPSEPKSVDPHTNHYGTTAVASPEDEGTVNDRGVASANQPKTDDNDTRSLWFFGTLIVLLLLLFGMTFRYYSRKEMREAEERWRFACDHFLTRMADEKGSFEQKERGSGTVWSRILNGEDIEEAELANLSGSAQ